jgi:hypothetical protein
VSQIVLGTHLVVSFEGVPTVLDARRSVERLRSGALFVAGGT